MKELIEYTGGSILLTILTVLVFLIGMAVNLANLFLKIFKNKYMNKSKKIEYIICIISSIIITFVIGCVCGYYFGIVQML